MVDGDEKSEDEITDTRRVTWEYVVKRARKESGIMEIQRYISTSFCQINPEKRLTAFHKIVDSYIGPLQSAHE